MMATTPAFSFVLSILFCQSMFMSLATTTTMSNGTISATQQPKTSMSQVGQTSQISPMSTGTTSNSAPDGITSSTSVLTTLAQSSITSQPEDLASNALATTSPLSASNTTVVASNLSPSEGSASSSTVTMTRTKAPPSPPSRLYTTLSSSTPTSTKLTTMPRTTKPGQATHLSLTRKTSTSMNSTWYAPYAGTVTHYQWTVSSLGPNKDSVEQTYSNTTDVTSLDINGLESGSICKVTVTSQIVFNEEEISGNPVHIIDWCTLEEGPGKIESFTMYKSTSESITVEWEKPSVRNGVIQYYEIEVLLDNIAENIIYLNCARCTIVPGEEDLDVIVKRCSNASVCDNAISDSKFRYNITGLHPFRTYKVTVSARTSKRGLKETSYFGTEESVPSGPPSFTQPTSTATEIQLQWNPPRYGDRNGKITTYNISYSYMEKTCTDDTDGQIKSIDIPLPDNSTSHLLTGLDPYTNYSVKIQASTKVGDGPFSDEIQILTLQSNPSKVRNLILTSKNSESFLLNWMVPCRPNGEITYYTIFLTNTDNNAEWNITSTDTSINVTENILPYSNYTINVIGNTVVGGDKTDNIKVTTSVGVPTVPKDVMVRNISSTKINVTWTTPELYTGPTSYTVTANDMGTLVQTKTVSGFHSTSVNIDGLDKYWLYDITVTAYTSAGDNETKVVKIRTAEDVPEQIKTLMLTPEPDVTKIRSIKVKWVPLIERDRNGIITHYFVQYSSKEETLTESLSSTSEKYVFSNIKPGNYTIRVFAGTSIGNGSDHSSRVVLEPGAPIKEEEEPGQPLMQQSSVAVPDAETQIAVDLPVDKFLCKTTNGVPVEWGVIVSEESAATEKPFVGSKSNYEKTKSQYSKWKDAKGKEPMPPYIATDPEKFNPCGNKGSRRRRDTKSTTFQGPFIAGQDGECPDSSQQVYCNGELPPNRNFRVKCYVCTAGGCTETNYGPSIKTGQTSAPGLTIPIVAGVVSAVVVIIVVVIAVMVMKRKQLICFDKSDDNQSHHEYEDLEELGRRTPNVPEYMTPEQINTADVHGVEKTEPRLPDRSLMDQFKRLKEKSPSHSMTVAESYCNRVKNRRADVLAFDHSRVKLSSVDNLEGSDYINANFILGYTLKREYIATQGPIQATFGDFWRMIWEQNVDTIVMLTKLDENDETMCDKYWPDISETLKFDDLIITEKSETRFSHYVERVIQVKKRGEVRTIHQFCYLKWFSMESLEPPAFLDFLQEVRNFKTPEETGKISREPIVVHCSDGVGRTGTFIAVDTLIQNLRNDHDVDIFNIVLEMRNYRSNMVQTESQYTFIHRCYNTIIDTVTTEETENETTNHIYINTHIRKSENVHKVSVF